MFKTAGVWIGAAALVLLGWSVGAPRVPAAVAVDPDPAQQTAQLEQAQPAAPAAPDGEGAPNPGEAPPEGG